jgi:hypothetical protein
MKQIPAKALKDLAKKSDTAEAIFNTLAKRERNRDVTDLRRLKTELVEEGYEVIPDEFTETFRALSNFGLGEMVKQPGKNPVFKWKAGLVEVGKAALGETETSIPRLSSQAVEGNGSTNMITIHLGNGREAKLSLPADLTAKEADRLAATIKAQV